MSEARVVPDQPEATVGMLFLPGAIEHAGFDLLMLSPRLAPTRVEGLVQVLHEVGGLAHDEEHIPEVSSGRPTPGWWRVPRSAMMGILWLTTRKNSGSSTPARRGETWGVRASRICGGRTANAFRAIVESPGRRGTAPAQLDPYEEP